MASPSSSGTYRLPLWIQRILLLVSLALIVAKVLLPEHVWGPIAVTGFALTAGFVAAYNKRKTGRYLPNTKRT